MTHPTSHAAPAGIDLDKLSVIADRVQARGLFNASCDIREWIEEARSALARNAACALAADDELVRAADAVVERWHSRDWKQPHTGEFIARLAASVGTAKRAAHPAPVAAHADDDCYCGGFGDVHQTTCPEAHAQQDAAPVCATCGCAPCGCISAALGKADAANAGGLTDAVDAAMVEMANIHPPLRRSECERLIRAALATMVPATSAADAKDAEPDEEDERLRFEKRFGPNDSFAWRNEDGTYKMANLQRAWEIWRAAIAASQNTPDA